MINKKTWQLYPYQQIGVDFLLEKKRAILGDDLGLGKTIQAISVANNIKAKKVLVLAPKILLWNWEAEIKKFANDPKLQVVTGTAAKKKKALDQPATWYITNYETAKFSKKKDKTGLHPIHPIFKSQWDLIICDEFHYCANRKTQRTKSIKKLKSEYFLGLTGTPILTKPEQLWSQLNILNKTEFSGFWKWAEKYCTQSYNPHCPRTPNIDGVLDEAEFRDMLAPYFLRRTKEEVLPDLPEKIFRRVPIELEPKHRKAYNKLEEDWIIEFEGSEDFEKVGTVLAQLIKLRQLCLDPTILGAAETGAKLKTLLELVEEYDGQIVIFSSFKTFIRILEKELKIRYGVDSCSVVTGDVAQNDRKKALENFTSGKSKFFIGTIKACNAGLNLQNASTLIFCDKDWSPVINDQVEGRVHRIGQKTSPVIISLVCKDTVEEDIEEMLADRKNLIEGVIMATALYKKLKARKK